MTGYCQDCGNQICLCKDIALQEQLLTDAIDSTGLTNHNWPYEKELHDKINELESNLKIAIDCLNEVFDELAPAIPEDKKLSLLIIDALRQINGEDK